jgi:glycosyltransferase involved in cell wall biosynthesis
MAAIRLHLALLSNGVNSRLLTLHKSTSSIKEHYQYQPGGNWKKRIELKLRQRSEHQRRSSFHLPEGQSLSGQYSMPLASFDVTDSPHWKWADVVNLHWVNEWISLENLALKAEKKPIIWTMHDMHAFTGGCHYSNQCEGFMEECDRCPMLANSSIPYLAHQFWKSKKTALYVNQPNLHIVAPSQWMVDLAAKSSLFSEYPGKRIFNSLNTTIFHPVPSDTCRMALGLPEKKKILLSVIQSLEDKRKGYSILVEALKLIPDPENWALCTVGKLHSETGAGDLEHIHLGSISDERFMAIIYNSASVFVHPATEDNLPNVIVEALCCGLPVAGFSIGGMPEMIENGKNGFLSDEISAKSLLGAIIKTSDSDFEKENIAKDAGSKFSFKAQSQEFMTLVQSILQKEKVLEPQ